jgi:hypothetical protein
MKSQEPKTGEEKREKAPQVKEKKKQTNRQYNYCKIIRRDR